MISPVFQRRTSGSVVCPSCGSLVGVRDDKCYICGRTNPGLWGFGPGDYTPTNDFREIWWSTKAISTQNNKPGAWIELNGGKRYLPGQVPSVPAPYVSAFTPVPPT